VDAELFVDPRQMALDGFLAEIERGRDISVGLSGGDEPGYFAFTR